VHNAVRHNRDGGWISIATEAHHGRAALVVANGGAAIAPADAPGLMAPFRRLGNGRARNSEGSGLGLSIVDSVARAHGGKVRIVAPGEGLVVTVELPA
jgi:signal transduction histidine kinase